MGSLTVVGRAWENPGDEDAWGQLVERYTDPIFRYAVKTLRQDEAAAREVVQQVFINLRRRFGNRKLGKPSLPSGTFKHYVFDAARSAVNDIVKKARRRLAAEARAARPERDESNAIAELEAEIDYREQFDLEVARCGDLYPEKLNEVECDGRTWEMFIRVSVNGEVGARLDKAYGFDRPGTVAQYARQVRNRLFDLLGLPCGGKVEADRSAAILREVVQRHERTHPNHGPPSVRPG
jgi:DNA-directed RNA polymerase specialized sigma24 family protein